MNGLFPEDEISAENNCILLPRANVQFVVSAAVAEYAKYSAFIFARNAGIRSATVVLCTRASSPHRWRRVVPGPWSASASEIYASLRAYLDIRHIQTCPTSIEQPPRGPKLPQSAGRDPSSSLKFVYTLTVAWRAFGVDFITLGKTPRT